MNYHQRQASLFDFEKKYNWKFNWDKLVDPLYESQQGKHQPLLLETLGFYDIFMPIRRGRERLGTVFSGAFAKGEVTYPLLRSSWNQLTRQTASPENAEFRQFARVMLETPVFDDPILNAYREALELFARVMAYENNPHTAKRLQELLTRVFSKRFVHSYFMGWALGIPTRQATPIWNIGLEKMDWIKTEIGITRIPTCVLAVIPLNTAGKKRDAVEEMIRIYRFQRRSFMFAQTLPQTVGGPLENYGALFVTSPDPAPSRLQRRRRISDIAERIHQFAMEELGGPVLVGIGESVTPGEILSESYRQAVLALHLERGTSSGVAFFNQGRKEKKEGILEIMRLVRELSGHIMSASYSSTDAVLDEFLQQVLTLSMQDPEEIRRHLQYALIQLIEAVKTRVGYQDKLSDQLREQLVLSLEKAGTTQDTVLVFKDALEKLLYMTQGPGTLNAVFSMEEVRAFVDGHFREPIKLKRLAKMAKVSVSTLSRRFKAATGVGLENYLQNLKLEEARRLLKTGSLPVAQVAKFCGFKPGSHFSRFFRKKTGISPQLFRVKSPRG